MNVLIKIWSFFVLIICKFWECISKEPANNVLDTDIPTDEVLVSDESNDNHNLPNDEVLVSDESNDEVLVSNESNDNSDITKQ